MFLSGQETPDSGTLLENWPSLDVAGVANLKMVGIRTVEQLASMPDIGLQKIMGGRALQNKAKAFLAAAKDGAAIEKYAVECETLKSELQVMRQQLGEVQKFVNEKNELLFEIDDLKAQLAKKKRPTKEGKGE